MLKDIYQRFPFFFKLKQRAFITYIWPHLHSMSHRHCLLSRSQKDKLNCFQRRYLRTIYHLSYCSRNDLYEIFRLSTVEEKFRKCVRKRVNKIALHERELIDCYLIHKNRVNMTHRHYLEEKCIQYLPRGRPITRLTKFHNGSLAYTDKLLHFLNEPST